MPEFKEIDQHKAAKINKLFQTAVQMGIETPEGINATRMFFEHVVQFSKEIDVKVSDMTINFEQPHLTKIIRLKEERIGELANTVRFLSENCDENSIRLAKIASKVDYFQFLELDEIISARMPNYWTADKRYVNFLASFFAVDIKTFKAWISGLKPIPDNVFEMAQFLPEDITNVSKKTRRDKMENEASIRNSRPFPWTKFPEVYHEACNMFLDLVPIEKIRNFVFLKTKHPIERNHVIRMVYCGIPPSELYPVRAVGYPTSWGEIWLLCSTLLASPSESWQSRFKMRFDVSITGYHMMKNPVESYVRQEDIDQLRKEYSEAIQNPEFLKNKNFEKNTDVALLRSNLEHAGMKGLTTKEMLAADLNRRRVDRLLELGLIFKSNEKRDDLPVYMHISCKEEHDMRFALN